MDQLKADVINALWNDSNKPSILQNIYPVHMSGVSNPVFPSISIGHTNESTERHWIGMDSEIQIDIWIQSGQGYGNDELWIIHNWIKSIINFPDTQKPLLNSSAFFIKLIYANDDLFEADTQRYHLCSRYQVKHF